MGKGLLAWWRRRIVARGLAGVGLFAVPVAVAALIGFGTSLSGVAGGLSAVTNGPDALAASAPTGPAQLNRAVVALASRNGPASNGNGSSGSGSGTSFSGVPDRSSSGTTGTSGGGGDNSGGGGPIDTISTPPPPDVPLPGGGGDPGNTVDNLNGAVNNVVGGVNTTLSGLLGR